MRLRFLQTLYGAVDTYLVNCPSDVSFDEALSCLIASGIVRVDLLSIFLQASDPEVLQIVSLIDLRLNSLLLLVGTYLNTRLAGCN